MPDTVSLNDVLAKVKAAGTKYEILGVSRAATGNEVRMAFRRLALLYHPDRHPEGARALAEEIFREITAAYRVLIEPGERAAYDRALAMGHEYRESAEPAEGPSLRDILYEVQRYEHIFSETRLAAFDTGLRDVVIEALLDDLGEQVVAVYPMKSVPLGATFQGTYKVGAIVVTSLRILLPFSYTWEEEDATTKTRYTGWSMPCYPLPLVDRMTITQRGRVNPKTALGIEAAGTRTEIVPDEADLAKVLLIARAWAVPVEASMVADSGVEFRRALFGPITKAGLWTAGGLAAAALLGIFFGGFVDNPAWLLSTGASTGAWHILFWLCAAASARRLRKYAAQYRRIELTTILESRPAEVTGTAKAVATRA